MRRLGSVFVVMALALATVILDPSGPRSVAAPLNLWSAAQTLSTPDTGAASPTVAVSLNGSRAIALWVRTSASGPVVVSAVATISGGAASWGLAQDVTDPGGYATSPEIAVSPDGGAAIATWVRNDGANYLIESAAATLTSTGASWGAPQTLSPAGANSFGPMVAFSSDATRATATWVLNDGSGAIIQSASAAVSGNTATWGAAVDLSAHGVRVAGMLALSEDGSLATAIWRRDEGLGHGYGHLIESASAVIAGSTADWGPAQTLADTGWEDAFPRLGVSSDGTRATAMWHRYSEGRYVIASASATVAGSTAQWGPVRDLFTPGGIGQRPTLEVSTDASRATSVWVNWDGTGYSVLAASALVAGTTADWGPETEITRTATPILNADLTLSSDGSRASMIWQGGSADSVSLGTAAATITGTTASRGNLASLPTTGGAAWTPVLATSSDGLRSVALWESRTGGPSAVRASTSVLADVPSAPTSLTVTPEVGQLTLAFAPPASDGGSPILNYEYSIDGGATWVARTPAATSSPIVISQLNQGTTYSVTLRAINAAGPGAAAAPVPGTTTLAPTVIAYELGAVTAPSQVLDGGQVSLTAPLQARFNDGHAGPAPAGAPLEIQYQARGKTAWKPILAAVTSETGTASVQVLERGDGRYRMQVGALAPSAGAYVDILTPKAKARATKRRVPAAKPSVTLTVRVLGKNDRRKWVRAPSGSTVLLRFRAAGTKSWQTKATLILDNRGMSSTTVQATRTGSWRIELPNTKVRSQTLKITVAK